MAQHHREAAAIADEVLALHDRLSGLDAFGRYMARFDRDPWRYLARIRDPLIDRLHALLHPKEQAPAMTAPATTITVRFVSDYDATGEWTDRQYKSIGRAFDAIDALPEDIASQVLLELVSSRLPASRQAEIAALLNGAS